MSKEGYILLDAFPVYFLQNGNKLRNFVFFQQKIDQTSRNYSNLRDLTFNSNYTLESTGRTHLDAQHPGVT